ncbi:MAG: hypothetical protein K0Q95_3111 [Bacteroidota bacterium]|jgi:hypothetical protein|nr:hypothetical protein [Bacteroidota bacterium]
MKKILLLSGVFAASIMNAQNTSNSGSEVLYPIDFHISPPLTDMPDFEETDNLYEKEEAKDREHRPKPHFDFTEKDGPEYGNDPASIQTSFGTVPNNGLKLSVAGQSGNGYPPDPSGAVGLTQYVQAVNATPFKVYNKTTGAQIMAPKNIGTLWSPQTGNMGDPIVLYDKFADRWFLAQFGQSGSTNYVYIAISTTNNAAGTYYTYTYTSAQFPDYLKFSIWADGYYMTSNQGGRLYVFERTAMLAGTPTARSVTSTFTVGGTSGFWCPLAADADGTLPPAGTACPFFWMTDNSWSGNVDGVKYCKATVNWNATPNPTLSITPAAQITTAAFNGTYNASWNDVPQPGTTSMLDGIGGVATYRAQYRRWTGYNTVLLNWGVLISATPRQRAIKWVELRELTTNPGVWTLFQEGTYQPDTKTRWCGSIAMDDNGSIGLAYARSASTTSATDIGYPSLCYTGRKATDPAGTMTFAETLVKAGTGSQTGVNRFGDYSHTSMDPDGVTFYHTSEYIGGTGTSGGPRTWIFSYQLPLTSVGVDEAGNQVNNVSAYTSNNEIAVKASNLNVDGEVVVDLFDASGKQLSGKQVMLAGNSFETSLSTDNLPTGMYLVRVGKVNTSFQRVVKVSVNK